MAAFAAGDIVVYRVGDGTGALSPPVYLPCGPASLAVADLNHDTHVDVIAADAPAGRLRIFSGDGTGTLTETAATPVGIGPGTLAFKDVALIRFSPDLPPAHLDSAIFLRGGSMLTGTLINLIGDNAEVASSPSATPVFGYR